MILSEHKSPLMSLLLVGLLILSCGAGSLRAEDWPYWRGPDRNGISHETGWSTDWPAEGPKILWKASVGIGFSSVSVSNGRAYTMGNRDGQDTLYCFDAETGEELWKRSYDCPLFDNLHEGGPCSTPTVDGDAIYTFSKAGDAIRFSASDGAVVWRKNLVEELGVENLTWNFAGSAVPIGDLVIFSAGPSGVALRKSDGSVVWDSGTEVAGYTTAVPTTLAGKRQIVMVGAKEVFGVDAGDGAVLWRYPWEGYREINAADAIIVDDKTVFVSSGYNKGAMLLEISDDGVTELWANRNLSTQLSPGVLLDGYIYGVDGGVGMRGPGNGLVTCIDVRSGEKKWAQEGLGTGSLILVDGKLVVLGEAGKLAIVEATPEGYSELASAQVLQGRCWTPPVLANGLIYARNAAGDFVCVDVRQ